MAEQFGYTGQAQAGEGVGEYGALMFLINQALARLSTATLVRVVSVTNSGGLSPVGFVDVQPLVNQLDGAGNAVPHAVLHQLPYFRLQGGTDAVILDPKVGDIGMAAFGSRDLSAVKASKQQANPGSWRTHDMADGLYFGGLLNGTPVQYVQFTAGGINLVSPSRVTVQAPNIELNAATQCALNSPVIVLNGTVQQGAGSFGGTSTWQGNMNTLGTLRNNGTDVGSTHTHPGVQSGPSNTGTPN
ncbi:Gp138 family membrane-puncturing spike protein [Achromobacter marplatensis]|uniref:Oxidoreductase n=1 Tax=Achromobacter marplatensis TaxID=470868 RepID=A0AA43B0T1_9BURK|nr:Gp138 family membrane-puncturing spike protein [Achromobacter marplatensis]MDH2051155.1 oxidoreductase [Achromobacter marplatensis]